MFFDDRPKIKLTKTKLDIFLEYLAFGLLVVSTIYAIYHYGNLPEKIPMHFNHKGEVNRYDNKDSIWVINLIGFAVVYFMYYLTKFPHTFNYPQKITPENAEKFYSDAVKMMRYTNAAMGLLFALITFEIVQIALNNSLAMLPVVTGVIITIVVAITVVPIIYLIKNFKKH
ncbi:DUF1648 domain-containing protein [Mangrovimonas cancribranchiae]|uniref:DUF1648 domain-containing protein n=1 Tax=Mangrovimonas cancribranchiae TaxID=3080055 RepID=A0AAU6P4E7_9FLAO